MRTHLYTILSVQRGFTLIELLVVIAIIGILSSVVLASLSTARNKGSDAAMKQNLANTRGQAELFASSNADTYTGVCATSGTSVIGAMVNAAERAYKGSVTAYANGTASTWNTAQCHDSANAWAAWVPYKDSTSAVIHAFCVDYKGTAKDEAAVLAASTYICP